MVSGGGFRGDVDRHRDTGQLSIALPVIIKEFNADLALASWIALVYALITASLYLPCGRMSDLFGLGKLFLTGFILYSLSSLAAGFAQRPGQLIFFRLYRPPAALSSWLIISLWSRRCFRPRSAAGRWVSREARSRLSAIRLAR